MSFYDGQGNRIEISGNGSGLSAVETVENGTVNLFTDYEYTDGIYFNGKNFSEHANFTLSEKIYECVGKEISVYFERAAYYLRLWCFDADDNYIGMVSTHPEGSSTAGETVVITTLEGTAYFYVNPTISFKNSGYMVPTASGISTTYYDYEDTPARKMVPLQKREEHEKHFTALDALLWNYTKWNGKTIVADGNSLVAANTWLSDLCEMLGATAVNLGKSGGAITRPDQPSADATVAEKMQYIVDNVTNNYPDKADLILLQESSYLDGEYSDQMDGADPKTTWTARMNYMIRCLKTKYPNVLIALMPDPTWYRPGTSGTGNDSTSTTGVGDQVFTERNRASFEKMRGLAEYNRLAFFDVDHSTPFNPLQLDNYYSQKYHLGDSYNQDGVHPYKPYSTAKGLAMAHFIAGLIFDPNAPNDAVNGWQDNIYVLHDNGTATYPGLSAETTE